jgi:hypothetical protein
MRVVFLYFMSLSRHSSLRELAQVAALYSKLCHLKDKGVTKSSVLTEKGVSEIKIRKGQRILKKMCEE